MSTAEPNADKLVANLKRVVRDSEELLQATAGTAGDKAREVRERLAEALEAAKRTCCTMEDMAIKRARATDKAIRVHPYQSIGVAFGIGLFIGALVTRKSTP